MKKNFLFIIFALISSCIPFFNYKLGDVQAVDRQTGQSFLLNYWISHGEVWISGKKSSIGDFTGKVLQIKDIQHLEKRRNPWLKGSVIENSINTSYARLIGGKRIMVECYITQKSKRNFSKGGYGTCYAQNGDIFDIKIIPR